MDYQKGTLRAFRGSWGSGLGHLVIDVEEGDVVAPVAIPCENAPTVRALDAAFGDVIAPGHAVNQDRLNGLRVAFGWDEMGFMLGWIAPLEQFEEELAAVEVEGG